MTTKQQMNPDTTKAGYLVSVRNPVEASSATNRTFVDADLLTARQNALQHAQQVMATKRPEQVLDITVKLIELDRSVIPNAQTVIATVFTQRFQRTLFIEQGQDLLTELDPFTAKSLPASLFQTLDLPTEETAGSSLEAVEQALTTDESAYYYRHDYPTSLPQNQE